jgi:starch phosphorylase
VGKERLVAYARKKVHQAQLNRGKTTSQVSWADEVLDPDILTIGFARRFATYKRATLLFRDVDRLRRLLLDADRPVQLIFAGKAHPKDEAGHHLLQSRQAVLELDIRHRLVLLGTTTSRWPACSCRAATSAEHATAANSGARRA